MIFRFFAFTLLFITSVALASQKLPPKANKKPVAAKPKSSPKRPTQLPKKKKISVDFSNNSAEHSTTVVVRTPLPLEEAIEDQASAEKSIADSKKQKPEATPPAKQSPQAPQPPIAVATPTPAPTPLLEGPIETPVVTSEPAPMPTPLPDTATVVTTTSTLAPKNSHSGIRILARTSYIDSKYSRLAPELQDGQSTLALGLENDFNRFTGRALLELGHGMDQAVTIQNTRSFIVRGDLLYFFAKDSSVRPLVGGGIGLVDVNVRSYRLNQNGQTYLREHARETSLLISPFAGIRAHHSLFSLDLTLEYTAVMVNEPAALGGWTGAITFGIPL